MTTFLTLTALLTWWAIICQAKAGTPVSDRVVKVQTSIAIALTAAAIVSFLKS